MITFGVRWRFAGGSDMGISTIEIHETQVATKTLFRLVSGRWSDPIPALRWLDPGSSAYTASSHLGLFDVVFIQHCVY
jgi:hypothetical protein